MVIFWEKSPLNQMHLHRSCCKLMLQLYDDDRRDGTGKRKSHSGKWDGFIGNGRVECLFMMAYPYRLCLDSNCTTFDFRGTFSCFCVILVIQFILIMRKLFHLSKLLNVSWHIFQLFSMFLRDVGWEMQIGK